MILLEGRLNNINTFELSNGVKIPENGFGVYQVSKEDCIKSVLSALKVGYRHIDTAQSYFNESEVGEGIKESGIDRKDIFLTTKVWIDNYGENKTYQSVIESMKKLKTDYLDLILLHQPVNDYYGAYRDLEKLYKEGKVRAIGVSNFYSDRLVDLCLFSEIKPMVNQIEVNPFNQREEDKKWADKYGVLLEAWAPLEKEETICLLILPFYLLLLNIVNQLLKLFYVGFIKEESYL